MKEKRFIITEDGKTFLWDSSRDLHTHLGSVKKEELLSKGVVETNKGKKLFVFSPTFYDFISRFKRGPAVIHFKDIGQILVGAHLNKNSRVIEAGTGTGFLASTLALFVKKVYSYEIRKDFFDLAKKNISKLNLNNIELYNEDVSKANQRNVDAIILDMPSPWEVVEPLYSKLKPSGFFVFYLPNVTQVQRIVLKLKEFENFRITSIKEILERDWVVDEKRARPLQLGITHTAFLVFARKTL